MEIRLTKDTDMTSDANASETNIPNTNVQDTDVVGMKTDTYCMLLHLSQLLNYASAGVSFLGLVVPIVLWAIAKDKSPQVDQHGKIALNWQISYLIYFALSGVLCIAVIGFVLLPVVFILGIVFPIIGAIKANEGTAWKYPLSIPFFK